MYYYFPSPSALIKGAKLSVHEIRMNYLGTLISQQNGSNHMMAQVTSLTRDVVKLIHSKKQQGMWELLCKKPRELHHLLYSG